MYLYLNIYIYDHPSSGITANPSDLEATGDAVGPVGLDATSRSLLLSRSTPLDLCKI